MTTHSTSLPKSMSVSVIILQMQVGEHQTSPNLSKRFRWLKRNSGDGFDQPQGQLDPGAQCYCYPAASCLVLHPSKLNLSTWAIDPTLLCLLCCCFPTTILPLSLFSQSINHVTNFYPENSFRRSSVAQWLGAQIIGHSASLALCS